MDLPSDGMNENHCTNDMAETGDDVSSSSSSDNSSSSDLGSDGSEDSADPKRDKGRGFIKLTEQKIVEFFRVKPKPKPSRPPQRPQEPKPQKWDHRKCCVMPLLQTASTRC
jgi:hypothetical protein